MSSKLTVSQALIHVPENVRFVHRPPHPTPRHRDHFHRFPSDLSSLSLPTLLQLNSFLAWMIHEGCSVDRETWAFLSGMFI